MSDKTNSRLPTIDRKLFSIDLFALKKIRPILDFRPPINHTDAMTTPAQLRADDRPCEPPAVMGARVRVLPTQATRERCIDNLRGEVIQADPDEPGMMVVEFDPERGEHARALVHKSQLMRITAR